MIKKTIWWAVVGLRPKYHLLLFLDCMCFVINGKQTAKALFPTDAIMSAMLAAAPAGILTVMLLFSPQLYSETGLDTVYYHLYSEI